MVFGILFLYILFRIIICVTDNYGNNALFLQIDINAPCGGKMIN